MTLLDISGLDNSIIGVFAWSYISALENYGADPVSVSAKMQKKIRKWVNNNCISEETCPPEVMRFVAKEVSDEDFIAFLKACYVRMQLNDTHKKEQFENTCAGLCEEAKNALWALFEHDTICNNFRAVGNDAQIEVESCAGYNRTLTLINASLLPQGEFDCLSFENGGIVKEGDEYKLFGETVNYANDLYIQFAVRFTDAKVDISLFRADEQFCNPPPWLYLISVAEEILQKQVLSGDLLNAREKELLPLIKEIGMLSCLTDVEYESDEAGFLQLTSYIIRFGYNELLPLIEKLKNGYCDRKKRYRFTDKLLSKLNTQKYEPLWREIYDKLVESQDGYLSKAVVYTSPELLNETRKSIQNLMESHGYSGEYPDFSKKGAIRNIRMADSYNMSYFIGAEKNVMHYIHCTEEYFNEHLAIQFLCGTEILRKNDRPGDIYSCLFNAKGRRFFQSITYERDYVDGGREPISDDLGKRVEIAVKKAELVKLTKEERKAIAGYDISYLQLFFFIFFVMGGAFGIFMTIGFMLISVLVCLVIAQPQAILSMITDIPWWALFLLTWILFGATMGVITVLAKRK